ncbi:hypothetical protein [Bacillus thuringiensis]
MHTNDETGKPLANKINYEYKYEDYAITYSRENNIYIRKFIDEFTHDH